MCKIISIAVLSLTMMGVSIASAEDLTGPQKNAVRSANNYLSFKGFSRLGLIQQLSSPYGDAYDAANATAAVDSLSVDWNIQAARSAKTYLEMMGFSCNGLIRQLSSDAGDKFTESQATYGAEQAGAC
ncbi:Ltp family lipoprotein [Hoeflea ulvae]|uniref:Ltp family lipoprotein n=1 Tax=Hoeflea ulvae TaxID=2983764 RepID=A0ABT3YI98_9HYPH|nr:Ltp family lipoprotein [Hoeflea ulvae]MCY0095630.1 Ltp family lipoprotein [Hoeflea ulvae]